MFYFNPLSIKAMNSTVEIGTAANICLGIEIFFLCFHLVIPGYYIYLGCTKSPVHINLQLIVCSVVGSSYVYVPVRFTQILYERDFIVEEKVYAIATIIRTWYHLSLLFTQLAAFVERLIASLTIEIYEKARLLFISVLLILAVNCISFSMSLSLYYDFLTYPEILLFMAAAETSAVPMTFAIYKINDKAKKRFATERARYSLSVRYQIHENFRLMKHTLKLIVVTVICVSLVAVVISLNVYNPNPDWRELGSYLFDISMTLMPLPFWCTVILSYPELRAHFFGLIGLSRFTAKVNVVVNQSDPVIYFQMLEQSWR